MQQQLRQKETVHLAAVCGNPFSTFHHSPCRFPGHSSFLGRPHTWGKRWVWLFQSTEGRWNEMVSHLRCDCFFFSPHRSASSSLGWSCWIFVDKSASHHWRHCCLTCTGTRTTAAKSLRGFPSWSAWEDVSDICCRHWTGATASSLTTSEVKQKAFSSSSSSFLSSLYLQPWRCPRRPRVQPVSCPYLDPC